MNSQSVEGTSSALMETMLLLQLTLKTRNSSSRQQQNAAVLCWHKDTEEQAGLARQVASLPQGIAPYTMAQPSHYAQRTRSSCKQGKFAFIFYIMQQYMLHHKRLQLSPYAVAFSFRYIRKH